MKREEVNLRSPLKLLGKTIQGGLGAGNLGVVMGRAGVGKTACLVQMALDHLMHKRRVLHVTLKHNIEHVQCWYDALFDDLAERTNLDQRDAIRAEVTHNRMLIGFGDRQLSPGRLAENIDTIERNVGFKPDVLIVVGYDWEERATDRTRAALDGFKTYARKIGAELWMSVPTHRELTGKHPNKIPPPCDDLASAIDVALFLEPQGNEVSLRVLKSREQLTPIDTDIHLHSDTLRLMTGEHPTVRLPTSAFTLLSGGAAGSESEFGRAAEKWGLTETNFTFEGRKTVRTRGLSVLTDEELAEGSVSPVFLKAHMHRTYPEDDELQKVLCTIWHQVSTAAEVFVIGEILEDKTVKGGTGWAAELARLWKKPVYVYDQERKGWFFWRPAEREWVPVDSPEITRRRFCGTGTRHLSDDGREAIRALFERSFGKR
jgi:hypothetical protein